ncbi:RES family NAD+ phosphorylase [Cobetia sp. Ld8]|uniref:RES family NAD+ phosphorylase n=1 Tax=Cobetia sp. Ld8 TaxID=649154 RepID=UPI0038697181
MSEWTSEGKHVDDSALPALTLPDWQNAWRVISSAFPPISVFEDILEPDELEMAFAIEALTNDRLREEAGELSRVAPQDRISGPGSTPVMAAFTHIGRASRFTDGSFGVYYCASTLDTAISETRFHMARFLADTAQPSQEMTMRSYVNRVTQPLHDIREGHDALCQPDMASYPAGQAFAARLREAGSFGLLYPSVRHAQVDTSAECAAILRPPAVSIPIQGPHLRYVWDGQHQAMTHVLEVREHR